MATRAAAAPRAQAARGGAGNRLLGAVVAAFQQPDIRKKLLFTFGILVIFRFVAHVPLPGVDQSVLEDAFEGNAVLGFLDVFSGGALRNLSVASLGVYPYMTSSIVMQLLIPMVPRLRALSQEGQYGRTRIQIYTHWLTVPVAMVQGYGQLLLINSGTTVNVVEFGFDSENLLSTLTMLFSMTAGTMFLVWIGEMITEQGVGNGISILIFGGIVAGLPGFIGVGVVTDVGFAGLFILAVVSVALVALIVLLPGGTEAHSSSIRPQHVPRRAYVPAVGGDAHTVARQLGRHDPADLRLLDHDLPGRCCRGDRRGRERCASGRGRVDSQHRRPGRSVSTGLLSSSSSWSSRSSTRWWSSSSRTWRRTCSGRAGSSPAYDRGGPTHEYIIRVLTRITWARRPLPGLRCRAAVLCRLTWIRRPCPDASVPRAC